MATPSDPTRPAGQQSTDVVVLATGPLLERWCRWVGWHLLELAAVGVPGVLAVVVSVWWAGLAVLAAGLWVAHEVRLTRRHRALTTGDGHVRDEEASAS